MPSPSADDLAHSVPCCCFSPSLGSYLSLCVSFRGQGWAWLKRGWGGVDVVLEPAGQRERDKKEGIWRWRQGTEPYGSRDSLSLCTSTSVPGSVFTSVPCKSAPGEKMPKLLGATLGQMGMPRESSWSTRQRRAVGTLTHAFVSS